MFFHAFLLANLATCLSLGFLTRAKFSSEPPKGYRTHLFRYLVAWSFCIAGEWFGGPGVYALYSSYGFTHDQIARIFVLGFVCSSVLGCCAGNFADRFGRKRSALLFCTFGVITVTCKHFASYPVLVFGRFFDGAHASLLYTAFESWLVCEHFVRHEFPPALLGHSFALMFTISYLAAVCCGFITHLGVQLWPAFVMGPLHIGGWCFPFEMSALCQIAGGAYIATNWEENYGMQPENKTGEGDTAGGNGLWKTLLTTKVLICCAVISCFESSMFIFVFSWTPALSPGGDHSKLPCGLIFATYMMACMSGASLYQLLSKFPTSHIMLGVTTLAATALAVPSFRGISEQLVDQNIAAFVLFEVCVGIYFPAIAKLKSEFVPEAHRVTIYNIFRTPMNLIVVVVLLTAPSQLLTFRLLCAMLVLASVLLAAFCASERLTDDKQIALLAA